jgi:hypothetical protein
MCNNYNICKCASFIQFVIVWNSFPSLSSYINCRNAHVLECYSIDQLRLEILNLNTVFCKYILFYQFLIWINSFLNKICLKHRLNFTPVRLFYIAVPFLNKLISQITYENNNNNSRRLPVRLYIGNPESLHKSYMYRGHLYLYCHV